MKTATPPIRRRTRNAIRTELLLLSQIGRIGRAFVREHHRLAPWRAAVAVASAGLVDVQAIDDGGYMLTLVGNEPRRAAGERSRTAAATVRVG